jgi:hypothetical protein
VKSPSLLLLRKNKREREKAREIEGEGEGERDLVRKRGREFIRNDRLGQVFYGGGSGEDQLSRKVKISKGQDIGGPAPTWPTT